MSKRAVAPIPYSLKDGSVPTYLCTPGEMVVGSIVEEYGRDPERYIIEAPRVFESTMRIAGCRRGRSAAGFALVNESTGAEHYMFMKDAVDMLQRATVSKGLVCGTWSHRKRGDNYGIYWKEEAAG